MVMNPRKSGLLAVLLGSALSCAPAGPAAGLSVAPNLEPPIIIDPSTGSPVWWVQTATGGYSPAVAGDPGQIANDYSGYGVAVSIVDSSNRPLAFQPEATIEYQLHPTSSPDKTYSVTLELDTDYALHWHVKKDDGKEIPLEACAITPISGVNKPCKSGTQGIPSDAQQGTLVQQSVKVTLKGGSPQLIGGVKLTPK